jgi:hypothetical protein
VEMGRTLATMHIGLRRSGKTWQEAGVWRGRLLLGCTFTQARLPSLRKHGIFQPFHVMHICTDALVQSGQRSSSSTNSINRRRQLVGSKKHHTERQHQPRCVEKLEKKIMLSRIFMQVFGKENQYGSMPCSKERNNPVTNFPNLQEMATSNVLTCRYPLPSKHR